MEEEKQYKNLKGFSKFMTSKERKGGNQMICSELFCTSRKHETSHNGIVIIDLLFVVLLLT